MLSRLTLGGNLQVTVANDQAHDWENHILLRVPDDIAPKVGSVTKISLVFWNVLRFLSQKTVK